MSRRRDDSPLCGLLLVDKPEGMTSHDVVGRVRRTLGLRRVGHAGTLDPLASGLLPCLVGPATRLVRFLHVWSKTYVGVIALGEETATGDREGREEGAGSKLLAPPPRDVIRSAVERLTGTYSQTPPAFSAKKIGGVPAHKLARRGFAPRLLPVTVTVHRLRVSPAGNNRLFFAARVSSGTYLRSLARDMGRLLGCGAHLEGLRRTRIGPLTVRAALSLEEEGVDPLRALLPPEAIPLPLPTVRLSEEQSAEYRHGRPVLLPGLAAEPSAHARVLAADGALAGIARIPEPGRLEPEVVLPPPRVAPGSPEC